MNNNNKILIRYAVCALIVFVILYNAWFYIMGTLAVYGLFTLIQQKDRWR
jgi:hypothetical protein